MKKLLIFALLSALILVSCGGGNRKAIADAESADPVEETDFFVFDLEGGIAGGPRAATFNELIDSIRYIPLETHPDGLMPAEQYYFTAIDGNMFIAAIFLSCNRQKARL